MFQVSIVCPIGTGPGDAQGIAAELDQQFPNNLRLSSGSFAVQQVTPLRERPGVMSEDRYTVAVDFVYRSDST